MSEPEATVEIRKNLDRFYRPAGWDGGFFELSFVPRKMSSGITKKFFA